MEGLTFTSCVLHSVSSRRILHTGVKKGFIIYKSSSIQEISTSTNEMREISFRKDSLS